MKKVLIIILCALMIGGGIAWFLFNKIVLEDGSLEEFKDVDE